MPKVKISNAIANEWQSRCPENIPEQIRTSGIHDVSLEVAKEIFEDAEYNSDPKAVEVGPYGMPLGTFNAYRALAGQVRLILRPPATCATIAKP